MKTCIWCLENESSKTFNKIAHTFPKSLGGTKTCSNVCDSCNHFFGSKKDKFPSIEIALKEILQVSKFYLNLSIKKKNTTRYKSEYFNLNYNQARINLKPKYKFEKKYQEEFGRRFKRGLYKVFLEERERILGDAVDPRFNFIREFSRFDIGDYPVYTIRPKFNFIAFSEQDIINPELRFTEYSEELDINFKTYECLIMGHWFSIPTDPNFTHNYFLVYKSKMDSMDHPIGSQLNPIHLAEDLDFLFKYMEETS